jgi:ssRNA-specific RNase YbeY (16S rRNA maturation enzyme)
MKRLLVHGLLHLAGMNHGRGTGGVMLALQERLLDTLQSEKVFRETRK